MSDDLIKRSDVIKSLNDYLDDCYRVSRRSYEKTMLDAISMDFEAVITNIPSVEPKQGEWIRHENPRYSYDREQGDINAGVYYTCSECNCISLTHNFCPNCGSYNRGEKSEID